MLRGLPAPDGPLFLLRGDRPRLYRIDYYGQYRAEGVEATAFEMQIAGNLPRARQSRSHSDRSKYSPIECTRKGKR